MDSLRDKSTPREVRGVLQGMQHQNIEAKTLSVEDRLYKAYDETMARIDKQGSDFQNLATQILLWITHAKRPLSTEELRHALAVEVGRNELDEDNLVSSLDVSICAGLAIVDDKTQEVRLVHYTAQEYLEQRHFKPPLYTNPHVTITDICVTYLMFTDFKRGPCTHKNQYLERISKYSLYLYAAKYWGEHAHLCSEASELLLGFLQCKETTGAAEQARNVGSHFQSFKDRKKVQSNEFASRLAFHLAVKNGLCQAAKALPEGTEDLNALDKQKTPLYMALERGNVTMAWILLRKGAQVRVLGGRPILTAFCYGISFRNEIESLAIEVFIDRGAEIADANGDCPLLVRAARYGHKRLVASLLRRGAKVESLGSLGIFDDVTPLFAAVEGGHLNITMILWKSGADPNRRVGIEKSSSLHQAVQMEHDKIVEIFLGIEDAVELNISGNSPVDISRVESLEYGLGAQSYDLAKACISISTQIAVDIELQDGMGYTPLALAAKSGHCRIAEILLSCGADIEAHNVHGETPLLVATRGKKSNMVKLLLEKGADIEARNHRGETPLIVAVDKEQSEMVKLLLEKGADVEAADEHGCTSLLAATYRGNTHLVELLLRNGADIEAAESDGYTPLLMAGEYGDDLLIEALLRNGANIEATDSNGYSPLRAAVYMGNAHLVELLLRNGANIEAANSDGCTPLMIAAGEEDASLVELLVEMGADTFARNVDGDTMLMIAAMKGNSRLAELFLQKGVKIIAVNEKEETALFCAVFQGHASLVKFLLTKGATIEPQDKHKLLKPLAWAEFLGHTAVARVLVEECPDIRNREDDGETLLCLAVRGAEEYWVNKLLEKGAKTEDRNGRDQTPLEVALDINNQHIVHALCKAGADVESADSHGRKHLEHAISKGLVECLKVLLQYGAKTDTGTFNSQTLFEMAYEGGSQDHREVYRVLMEHGGFVLDTTPVEHWDWLRYDE